MKIIRTFRWFRLLLNVLCWTPAEVRQSMASNQKQSLQLFFKLKLIRKKDIHRHNSMLKLTSNKFLCSISPPLDDDQLGVNSQGIVKNTKQSTVNLH